MKKQLLIIAFSLILIINLATVTFCDGYESRLIDEAKLLTGSEAQEVLAMLDETSNEIGVDIVIYTEDQVFAESALERADGIFEDYNYGIGADRSCVLLYINIASRDWHITTAGYGITAVTDAGLTYLSDQFVPYLSDGEYSRAFEIYTQQCKYLVDKARSGDPFDSSDLPKAPFRTVLNLAVCLIIGIVGSNIVVGKHKAKLKTVNRRETAGDYSVTDSLAITDTREVFLYKTVTRTVRKTESESTTHVTKSGTRVGGGGGKF